MAPRDTPGQPVPARAARLRGHLVRGSWWPGNAKALIAASLRLSPHAPFAKATGPPRSRREPRRSSAPASKGRKQIERGSPPAARRLHARHHLADVGKRPDAPRQSSLTAGPAHRRRPPRGFRLRPRMRASGHRRAAPAIRASRRRSSGSVSACGQQAPRQRRSASGRGAAPVFGAVRRSRNRETPTRPQSPIAAGRPRGRRRPARCRRFGRHRPANSPA